MSTRAAICTPRTGNGFVGVYHHWDGYPNGLGASLFIAFRNVFGRDYNRMIKALVLDHPAGWSSLVGADLSLEPGFVELGKEKCGLCSKSYDEHREDYSVFLVNCLNGYQRTRKCNILGHEFVFPKKYNPRCFCHGDRKEGPLVITTENASECGCEYVYVLERKRDTCLLTILSSYCPDGEKMIGAFGSGDPKAFWRETAVLDLNGSEPNWEHVNQLAIGRLSGEVLQAGQSGF